MALLGRDTKVTGSVDEGVLLLETFQGKEALGTPYRYDLTLLSDDANLPVDKVLGQSLTVHIKLDTGATRYFGGIVTYFAKVGMTGRHTRYAAIVNPKLSLFDYTRDCRIFFDLEASALVTEVLGKRGFTEVESGGLQGTYRKREYTVQYRETDFNLVQRLLEEDGIYYFFRHEKDKHTLVLADAAGARDPVSVLYLPKQRRHQHDEEHFWSLTAAGSLYPGKFSILRDYDYTQPKAKKPQIEHTVSPLGQPGGDFEDYDYPGGLSELADAEAEARVRHEGDHVMNTLIEVEGNTVGLGIGDLVKLRKSNLLEGEFNPFWNEADFDKQYLITSATYSISINQYETGDVADSDEPFKARFSLLDSQAQFRPTRTAAKPRIEGPQTAIVVGESGDEIYTDKYGRVKVQFDWDRIGERNQDSSIWVRVSQVWAGKQWGAIHIPRVGQEVIVDFLDGDPDRPIITGRVYNQDSMPPYPLPANMTQSGIKSRSSKGGSADNFNEIRFEDLKGKEELHIQAELDMSTKVKRNQTLYVGGDQNITIHGNQTITIEGSDEKTGKKLPVQSVTKVTGKHTFDASDTIKIQAPTSITLECGGSTIVMEPGKIAITAGGGAKIVLDANALVQSAAGAKTLHNANVLSQSVPGATLQLDAGVSAQSVPGSTLALDANATVQGTAEATMAASGSSVKTSPAGVDVSGPKVNVSGSGMVSVTGGIVKINS